MERKIGEIFERNGEWYQCLEEKTCTCFGCDLRDYNCGDISLKDVKGSCQSERRKDNKSVIFKKLEKLGEPYKFGEVLIQQYQGLAPVVLPKNSECSNIFRVISSIKVIEIEIKQNQEDMEEKELTYEELLHYYHSTVGLWAIDRNPQEVHFDWICKNAFQLGMDKILSNTENIGKNLKPFNIEEAKAGKPVCTRDGRPARIICFNRTGKFPVVALVEAKDRDDIYSYLNSGKDNESVEKEYDLMMLSEKEEGFINIYRNDNMFSCSPTSYKTRGEAFNGRKQQSYLCTVKVEWEG